MTHALTALSPPTPPRAAAFRILIKQLHQAVSVADDKLALLPLIAKDQIGWSQSRHTDLPRLLASGVIHITESIEGTEFYDTISETKPVYVAPTKPRTGAFWLNSPTSFHQVSKVTLERNHFLFVLSIMEKQ